MHVHAQTQGQTGGRSASRKPSSVLSRAPVNGPATGCACGGTCPRCRAQARQNAGGGMPVSERSAPARALSATDQERLAAGLSAAAVGVDGAWLAARMGAGTPLDDRTRSAMESRLGADLSAVRIHTGGQAAAAATRLNANALTVGQHIAFREGQYAPHTEAGRRLLLHELTHTRQQRGVRSIPSGIIPIGRPGQRSEREAESTAQWGGLPGGQPTALGPTVSLSLCGTLCEAVAWGATSALVAAVAVGCAGGSVVTFGGLAIPCTALVIGSAAVGAVDAVLWSAILKEVVCGEQTLSQATPAAEGGGAGEPATAMA